MRKIHNNKNLYKSIILLVILAIGIGYAYLTSNLSISGQTEVVANTWDIHFENLNVKEGSVTASTPASIQSNNVDITYSITLARPKEYYEFTVDVKNDGTLPGKVSISSLSGLDTTSSKVIDYSIKYTNDNPVNVGDIINAGAKKSIKVRVFYKDDISSSDFPVTDLNLNLTYTLQYVQSEEDEVNTNTIVQELKTNNTTCFTKYTGQVTDQVGQTVSASNVYFNKCADKRNIIFNNMCWQMIRTTETSGIKMLYNGLVDENNKCSSSRGDYKGILGIEGSSEVLNSEYSYGSSFTYDTTNNTFTLIDTTTATWSDLTYENLLGKFTCKNTTGTCTTLYNINGYGSSTSSYASLYTIGDINYTVIGKSPFNAYHNSLAMVGYMFNKVYSYAGSAPPTSTSLIGNDVSYSNGIYTLLPASEESTLSTTLDNTHHYTCNNTTGMCNKVRYYYYSNYYIELNGEESIEEAVNNMLYNDNVNKYDSSAKGIIDAWYRKNLLSKTSMLEDTVYCNARNMINGETNGWNKEGNINTIVQFKNYNENTNLACPNITDQLSIMNSKARLTYPVALLTNEERYNINTPSLLTSSERWWELSPFMFDYSNAYTRHVTSGGGGSFPVYENYALRPVISLKNSTTIKEGDGSETSPWVVE